LQIGADLEDLGSGWSENRVAVVQEGFLKGEVEIGPEGELALAGGGAALQARAS
jgi:hypothetical protein